MYRIAIEVLPLLIFLTFLLLMVRFRSKYFEQCPQSWRVLALGGFVLSVAGGIKLVHNLHQELDLAMPKLHAFISAVEISGYIVGGGLVLLGFLNGPLLFPASEKLPLRASGS